MQKLPVGRQNFKKIRENNYLYVDKTKYILEMINHGDINFLSRPRRFGKSLLLSTLKELFEGNKKLFKDLYIYDKWDWEESYPVITLDFGGGEYDSLKNLDDKLQDMVSNKAREFNIELYSTTIGERFKELIIGVYKKTKKDVVILIDEYDKPIISNLKNKELSNIQKKLGSFYEILKVADEYIKFIFITGISKIAHVSVFSKLNSPKDLTLNSKFNCICGYTQEELEYFFKNYIEKLSKKLDYSYNECLNYIKLYYDGYSWNGKETVYNPFSTLLCFDEEEFSKNWFNTGTPSVLIDYPMSKYTIKSIVEPSSVTDDEIKNPSSDNIKEEVLLFQTGYLTVEKFKRERIGAIYDLKIPNFEVESAFFENLITLYSNISYIDFLDYADKLLEYTIEGNEEKIIKTIGDYLSPIPYELKGDDEKYYHSIIFLLLYTARVHVHNELHSNKGSADLIIEEGDYVIILEFKQSKDSTIDYMIKKGFKQIEEKEYSRQYKNKKIIKTVIAFKDRKEDKELGCKIVKE
ncbi:ATP-binding protein [Methanobrevibacter curvatus]|uniref:Putative AAA-ATPase n=1 Tax=Methanobrevibacter curvatus TaxID=49547 RepID=A0A165ZI14_9EURY|nr:ATP-binding protein [Methanobrevibacter curvatus]KZX10763.1 putative AAA-ATPase [Methanobrevibacter curvatus]